MSNPNLKLNLSDDFSPLVENLLYIVTDNTDHRNYLKVFTKKTDKSVRLKMSDATVLLEKMGGFYAHHCAKIGKSLILNFDNLIIPETFVDRVKVMYKGEEKVFTLCKSEVKQVKEYLQKLETNPLLKVNTSSYELAELLDSSNNSQGLFVDLKLPSGIKWFSRNMELDEYQKYPLTEAPEQYGSYISWGEYETKDTYDEKSALFEWGVSEYGFRFEEDAAEYGWDKSDQLPDVYDAANRLLHFNCHIPTVEEWKELRDNCTFVWVKTQLGTRGLLATSKHNNESIFLPATGFMKDEVRPREVGHRIGYWSSTICDKDHPDKAYVFAAHEHENDAQSVMPRIVKADTYLGLAIRPVYGGSVPSSQARESFCHDDVIYRVVDEEKRTCKVTGIYPGVDKASVSIPEYVTSNEKHYRVIEIIDDAIRGVKSLLIPKTVMKIPAPQKMRVLETIEVATDHPRFSSIDGVLVDKDASTLLYFPVEHEENYTLPACISKIADSAFYGALVKTVDLNNVQHIGEKAFYLSSIKSVSGRKVTRIEEKSFGECMHLESFNLSSIQSFGLHAVGSVAMTYLHLPATLKKLNQYTFDCPNLKKVVLDAMPAKMAPKPFMKSSELKSFIVNGEETINQ